MIQPNGIRNKTFKIALIVIKNYLHSNNIYIIDFMLL